MASAKMNMEAVRDLSNLTMAFKATSNMFTHPKVHIGMNSLYMQQRKEIHALTAELMRARKEKLRELFYQDFLQEDAELREVDLAFINTQP